MEITQIKSRTFQVDDHQVMAHDDGLRCWGKGCDVVRDCKHSNAVFQFLLRKVIAGETLKPIIRNSMFHHVVHLQWRADNGHRKFLEE